MEQLQHHETELESQVATYKSQLSLVEQQLASDGSNTDSLEELSGDLKQLIALTEESLLEVKKQKLLLMLQPSSVDPTSASMEDTSQTKTSSSPVIESEPQQDDDKLHGMKCSAPLRESWGAGRYHNAMIMCKEPSDNELSSTSDEDFTVRVLFTQPLYPAMKACPFFLEGSCKFTEEACKFSHGYVVAFSELQTYQEPEFEFARVGGKCLAKHTDDLWYPAIISSLGETVEVHFNTLNVTAQLELDHVMPQESSDESDGSSDSSEDDECVRVVEGWPLSSGANQPLGNWEKFTKGVGSRLLTKMGYIHGQGLGKAGQGRVTPVEITVLPAGKSLDACAEIREKKKAREDPGKRRRRKKKNKKIINDETTSTKEQTDMFEFLNTRIFKKDEAPSQLQIAKERYGASASTKDNDNLNIKLFKVQEDIKLMKKRKHSLQESLLRHRGKNKAMETHVTDKLAHTDREMSQLVREEQSLLKKISSKSQHKKLSVF